MVYPKIAILALLLLLLSFQTAHADSYLVRTAPGISTEALTRLAKSSKPLWHTITFDNGTTLREAVQQECGDQNSSIFKLLLNEALRINNETDLERKIPKGVTVGIPFCLKLEKNVVVTVQPNDTVESILKREAGIYGPKTKSQVYALNQQRFKAYEDAEQMSRHLIPGMNITIPYRSAERMYMARSDTPHPADILRTTNISFAQSLVVPLSSPPMTGNEVEYVSFVSSTTASKLPGCVQQGQTSDRHLFADMELLKERLDVEWAALGANHLGPTLIGLIDSGIRLSTFDSRGFFLANSKEKNGVPNKDDDQNGRIDDIYGINFNVDNGFIDYYDTDSNRSHGTKIATLVLGGPAFTTNTAIDPNIRLKMVNFSSSITTGTVGPVFLSPAIEYLSEQKVNIVNMSLATKKEFLSLRNALQATKDILFVAAAGNGDETHSRGINIGLEALYPARFGGYAGFQKDKILTVGAHDLNGDLARFSNFSKDFVDVLAPGCSISTNDIDGKVVLEHGTSPATAIVSFAAGLLRHLGIASATGVKNRLLYSADVDDKLSEYTWSSGRINIVKAVSLHYDVIELRSGGKYVFAELQNPNELSSFCSDPDKAPFLKNIVKIRPNVGNEIEYWTELHGQLSKTRCLQANSNAVIGLLKRNNQMEQGPQLTEVKDIVLAKPN